MEDAMQHSFLVQTVKSLKMSSLTLFSSSRDDNRDNDSVIGIEVNRLVTSRDNMKVLLGIHRFCISLTRSLIYFIKNESEKLAILFEI